VKVSLISWVNKPAVYEEYTRPSFEPGVQAGEWDIERIWITRHEYPGVKNIGQAYNLAQSQATGEMLVYVHQDLRIDHRSFLVHMATLLQSGRIGLVGAVGATIDTGGGYWHAPFYYHVGYKPDVTGRPFGDYRVALIDGILAVTKGRLPWAECYVGPHLTIEDYCMRTRAAGKQVWVGHIPTNHQGSSTLDDGYWNSMAIFRKRWGKELGKHNPKNMLPLPTLERYRRFWRWTEENPRTEKEWDETGAWAPVWRDWQAKKQRYDAQEVKTQKQEQLALT